MRRLLLRDLPAGEGTGSFSVLFPAQQYAHGTAPTLCRPRLAEGENLPVMLEPVAYQPFEDWDLAGRTQAFPMDNADTGPVLAAGFLQEPREGQSCLICRVAMQVKISLDTELSPAQVP